MSSDKGLKNLSVLFVEDEANLLGLLVSAIGSRFGSYEVASNGLVGVEKAKEFKPDIIISDITMPKMDGLEMAKEINSIMPKIPIIILSAYSDKEKLLRAIDIGITKYFIKPFDPDELLEYLYGLTEKISESGIVKLLGSYRYDINNQKLLKETSVVRLTGRELAVIDHLIKAPNHIISNSELKKLIGKGQPASDESMRVFIRRLREKTDKEFIKNLPKQGYLLHTP